MVYNHVGRAISPGFDGEANSFPASVLTGDVHTLNFTYTLPAEWDENKIHIVGLLLDPQGRVDNASKSTIPEAVTNGFIDVGGTTSTTEILPQPDELVKLYPNPAKESINIQLNLKEQSNIDFNLKDVSGKTISTTNFSKNSGIFESTISIQHLNSGIYYAEFLINNKFKAIKFVKE